MGGQEHRDPGEGDMNNPLDKLRAKLNRHTATLDDIPAEALADRVEQIAADMLIQEAETLDDVQLEGLPLEKFRELVQEYGISVREALEVFEWAEKLAANQRGTA